MSRMVAVEIWAVSRLSENDADDMEFLYRSYYEGAEEGVFRKDLEDKDWVVLLRQSVDSSERSRVVGFSTMKFMSVAGEDILFSGDTVVDEACRVQSGLAGAFGHVMKYLFETGKKNVYWFLICKGARTYRFLPTFFHRYVPGENVDIELSAKLKTIASALYPDEYDEKSGILHFGPGKDRLKTDVLRRDMQSVRFRLMNPGWSKGDELCCLAPLSMDNLNRLGHRVIADVTPKWYL